MSPSLFKASIGEKRVNLSLSYLPPNINDGKEIYAIRKSTLWLYFTYEKEFYCLANLNFPEDIKSKAIFL